MAAPTSALVNDSEGGLAMALETDRFVFDSNDDCNDKNDGNDAGMWGGGAW